MTFLKYISILASITLYTSHSIGYVCGYTRLLGPDKKTRIDLIHDFHIPKSPTYKKAHWIDYCYRSEQTIYAILKNLNHTSICPIDVVWEAHEQVMPRNGLFISHAALLKQKLTKQVHLVYSDTERNKFEQTMLAKKNYSTQARHPLSQALKPVQHAANTFFLGCKALVEQTIVGSIRRIHGKNTSKKYTSLFQQNRRKLHKLAPHQGNYQLHDLLELPPFHEIADIEMLGNILSSDKERVMVYAGHFHCLALKEELLKLGYIEVQNITQNIRPACSCRPRQMQSRRLKQVLA